MSRKRQSQVATDRPPLPVSMELVIHNEDLLMQIFLFLPAKSLIRFKSVCKKWLSLISSDDLCHQHTLRRPKLQQSLIIQMHSSQLFYLNGENGEKVMIPYSLSVLVRHQIVQACHGLLLLHSKHPKNSYYVYNPTTRRLRKIILIKRDDFPYVVAVTLAFDPSKSPYYKVVCFRSTIAHSPPYDHNYYVCQIEVYDSESHTWKRSLEQHPYARICDNGLYWNNYIFWRHHRDDYFYFDIAENVIAAICFATSPYESSTASTRLQESNGHLYLFILPKSGHHAPVEGRGVVREMRGDMIDKYLGALHDHIEMETGAKYLMMRSGVDVSTCSVITYEAERRRIIAYNYLNEGSELLVDLTRQPVSETDQVAKAFQFGEVLALV